MTDYRHVFDKKQSLLQIYVFLKDYEKLKECLESGELDVNNGHYMMSFMKDIIPSYGWTPLHISVFINDPKSAQILLKYGADVNSRTKQQKYTPLHVAALKRNEQMCRFLIGSNANINAKDGENKTPLELCLSCPKLPLILIRSGADFQKDRRFEKHPLIFKAITKKNLNLVQLLTSRQLRGVEYNNMSPIEYAMDIFPECVPDLIKSGKQIHFANRETGEYPIHLAVRKHMDQWIELMADQKCNPNVPNSWGNRPLHIAAQNDCHEYICLVLISMGANTNYKNNLGLTPMYYAIEHQNEELTQLFLKYGYQMTRNLDELHHSFRYKKFKCSLILLKSLKSIDKSIRFDSEPIIWVFVKNCVGEQEVELNVLADIMKLLIDMTSDVNTIDNVWGSLMHFLIYADICSPTPCYKTLFDVLIGSLNYDINYEFTPKDTRLKTGEVVVVERILANGSALSFALEMSRSGYYSEKLIRIGANYSTINWDHIFFAPEKADSLKMLIYSGDVIPDYFREDSNPLFDESVSNQQIDNYCNEFKKFIEWLDQRKKNPYSLRQITRNYIRKAIASNGLRQLSRKGMPLFGSKYETQSNILCDYLLFHSFEDFI